MFLKLRTLLKLNYILFLENELLRDGNFQNVVSGLQFYDGSDMSRLVRDDSPVVNAELGLMDRNTGQVTGGRVYQSAFRNWVYESGIALNPGLARVGWPDPIRVSGVYVDGRFCPTSSSHPDYDASCAHAIDYLAGRVVFDSALPTTSTVHADFAYKTVAVMTASKFNNQLVNGILETKFTTNPRTANQLVYPSGNSRIMPYPIIFIEDAARDFDAYQLGDRSLIANDEMVFHIYALDESTRDNLIDLISFQERKRIPLVDFNYAPFPLSGIMSTLSPEYIPYIDLVLKNNVVSTTSVVVSACNPSGAPITTEIVRSQRAIGFLADIEDTSVVDLDQFITEADSEVIERGTVRNFTRVYTIQPVGPLGYDSISVFPSGLTTQLP